MMTTILVRNGIMDNIDQSEQSVYYPVEQPIINITIFSNRIMTNQRPRVPGFLGLGARFAGLGARFAGLGGRWS